MNTLTGPVLSRVLIAALVAVALLFVIRVVAAIRRGPSDAAAVDPPGERLAARPETPAGAGRDAPAPAPAGVDQPEERAA